MTPDTSIVVSDLHLGAIPASHEVAFIDFLHRVPSGAPDLVINGDLFDYWFEYRSVVLRRHFRVLRTLSELVEAGVTIRLVGGNHDAWGGSFLQQEIGIRLVDGPVVTLVGGRRTYLAHGDGLGSGAWTHRLLRWLTQNPVAVAAFRQLHPDWAAAVATRVSSTAANYERGPGANDARVSRLAAHASNLLHNDPQLELVILGHCHRPDLIEVEPGRHYLNAGDWIHHLSYAMVSPDSIELLRWSGP